MRIINITLFILLPAIFFAQVGRPDLDTQVFPSKTSNATITGSWVFDDVLPRIGDVMFASSLAELNTAISQTAGAIIITDTITLTANKTITNDLLILSGGYFTGDYTLTLNGNISAGLYHIFDNSITTSINQGYVEWFGAVGDGSTDDATAFADAMDACDKIIISNNRYKLTTLNYTLSKKLVIDGGDGILDGDSSTSVINVQAPIFVNNLTLFDFRRLFYFNGNLEVDTVYFINTKFDSCVAAISYTSTYQTNFVKNVFFENCIVENCISGIGIGYKIQDAQFINCKFKNLGSKVQASGSSGIFLGYTAAISDTLVRNVIVDNCIFENIHGGTVLSGEGYEVHAIQINANYVNVSNNIIRNVWNMGTPSGVDDKAGGEAIYIKGNNCRVYNNSLYNCYGEAAIAFKALRTKNNKIYNNFILNDKAIVNDNALIMAYDEGAHIFGNSLIDTVNTVVGITIALYKGKYILENNHIVVNKYAHRVMQEDYDSIQLIINGCDLSFRGTIMSFENQTGSNIYDISVTNNNINCYGGRFFNSNDSSHAIFTGNIVNIYGSSSYAILNWTLMSSNVINFYGNYDNRLIYINNPSYFINNVVNYYGDAKYIIQCFDNSYINGNYFNSLNPDDNLTSVIDITTQCDTSVITNNVFCETTNVSTYAVTVNGGDEFTFSLNLDNHKYATLINLTDSVGYGFIFGNNCKPDTMISDTTMFKNRKISDNRIQ